MNNWDYANRTPTWKDGFNGTDSIVRQIQLKHKGGNQYSLASHQSINWMN
jgi:levanbiose-producing levanase